MNQALGSKMGNVKAEWRECVQPLRRVDLADDRIPLAVALGEEYI